MTGPYGATWDAYRRAGWTGVLPLPARRKSHPPKGWTGEAGAWPSVADCHAWADGTEGAGNIALRLPHHVIGIDVDAYGTKQGAATLAEAEDKYGPLPATWRTTSRDDGVSGIRLYRIPEGLHWPGEIGDGIELLQYRHRYAVVAPSLHPEGRTYRWITPEGVTSTAIPDPDTLPLLPDAWVDGLTGRQQHRDTPRNDLTTAQTQAWVIAAPGATDEACARMRRAIEQATTELAGTGSAHNAARDGALRAVRLADEGHAGLAAALGDIHGPFIAAATDPKRPARGEQLRTTGEAEREWGRILTSAVGLVTATSTGETTCDCAGQLTGLILGGAHPFVDGATALAPPHIAPDEDPPKTEPDDDEQPRKSRTSWYPRDLTAILTGTDDEPTPAMLRRADGCALLYPGKINGLLGESESGKTWLALLAAAQTLQDGGRVSLLDFEDTARGAVGRLQALGVTDDQITTGLAYIGPDGTLDRPASDDLADHLTTTRPDLIILDGVNAAMTLLGLDLNSNTDATKFHQLLLRQLASAGACVVAVDHVPKASKERGKGGIGAQAKRAMLTGAAITVEVDQPFGRGMTGRLRLNVDKDRPGHVRAISAAARHAGTAVLESDAETGMVTVTIRPPDSATPGQKRDGRNSMLMEKISEYLFESPERTSLKGIREAMGGRAGDVDAALDELIERGHVAREERGRGYTHTLLRPYSVAEDLSTDDRVPPCPDRVPDTGGRSGTTVSQDRVPPFRGARDRTRSAAGSGHPPNQQDHGTRYDPDTDTTYDTQTGEIITSAGDSA